MSWVALLAVGALGCADAGMHGAALNGGRDGEMQARFEASGSLETSCGTTTGVRLEAKGPGEAHTGCEADWQSYDVGGEEEHLADCFFVVEPGDWTVTELSAIDENGDALQCCESELPDTVTVEPSETSEVSGSITCDSEQNGGLDVFVTINRPPVIEDVNITPSKFGTTCEAIGLEVVASDSEGDDLKYTWAVVSAPVGSNATIEANAQFAAFASSTLGDYEIRVTAQDETGASASLDFPLHIIGTGDTSCDVEQVCLLYLDIEL